MSIIRMHHCHLFLGVLIVLFLASSGCAGGPGSILVPDSGTPETPAITQGGPTQQPGQSENSPQEQPRASQEAKSNHLVWGLWQFKVDPVAGTIQVVPLREAAFHLNALPFLEPPVLVLLSIESQLQFSGGNLDVDIGLKHPFIGLNEFTGFDVRGILISTGNKSGFQDSSIKLAYTGTTRLLNPDGLTRWWNPREFPYNSQAPIFGYVNGALGTPDSLANFTSTLNGYKYFSDDLGVNDGLDALTPGHRGYFTTGTKNVRHYKLQLGAGLVFNYAVDASWEFPLGQPPYPNVPQPFPIEANAPEAYWVDVEELGNTLWNTGTNSGGDLQLKVNVHTFRQNAEESNIWFQWPGSLNYVETIPDTGTGALASATITLTPQNVPSGILPILIGVECPESGYQTFLPGKPITAFRLYETNVSPIEPNDPPVADAIAITPTTIKVGYTVSFDGSPSYDPDGTIVSWIWDSDNDGIYDDAVGTTPTINFPTVGTFFVDLKVTDNDGATDTLDTPIQVDVIPNQPPVAQAIALTSTTIKVGKTVKFDASTSYDPDGTITSYAWENDGDGQYDDDVGVSPTIQFNGIGIFYVDVRVTDNDGATDTLDITIPVTVNANQPPVAQAVATTSTNITVGQSVSFNGSTSYDPDGSIISYNWDSDGDSLYDDASGVTPTIQFNTVGTFFVDLKVTDDDAATDTLNTKIQVNVSAANLPPVAGAVATTTTTIPVGGSVSFNGSSSYDTDGTIVSYQWEKGDNSLYNDAIGVTCSLTYNTAGDFYVDLKVTDNDGATDVLNTKIHVTVTSTPFTWDPDNPGPPPFTWFTYDFLWCTPHENWDIRYDPAGGVQYADTGDMYYFEESGTLGATSAPDAIHKGYQFDCLVSNTINVPNVAGNVTLTVRHFLDMCYDNIFYLGGDYMDGAQVRITTNATNTPWTSPTNVLAQTTLLYPTSGPAYGIIGSGFVNNYLNGQMGFRGPDQSWLATWQTSTFNLNAYKGQTVRIGYVFSAGFYALMGGCNWNGDIDYRYGVRVGKWQVTTS